jgi:hypothetical protein
MNGRGLALGLVAVLVVKSAFAASGTVKFTKSVASGATMAQVKKGRTSENQGFLGDNFGIVTVGGAQSLERFAIGSSTRAANGDKFVTTAATNARYEANATVPPAVAPRLQFASGDCGYMYGANVTSTNVPQGCYSPYPGESTTCNMNYKLVAGSSCTFTSPTAVNNFNEPYNLTTALNSSLCVWFQPIATPGYYYRNYDYYMGTTFAEAYGGQDPASTGESVAKCYCNAGGTCTASRVLVRRTRDANGVDHYEEVPGSEARSDI